MHDPGARVRVFWGWFPPVQAVNPAHVASLAKQYGLRSASKAAASPSIGSSRPSQLANVTAAGDSSGVNVSTIGSPSTPRMHGQHTSGGGEGTNQSLIGGRSFLNASANLQSALFGADGPDTPSLNAINKIISSEGSNKLDVSRMNQVRSRPWLQAALPVHVPHTPHASPTNCCATVAVIR